MWSGQFSGLGLVLSKKRCFMNRKIYFRIIWPVNKHYLIQTKLFSGPWPKLLAQKEASARIPTVKSKIPGKGFLKSESRTSVTFKLKFLTLATYQWQRLGLSKSARDPGFSRVRRTRIYEFAARVYMQTDEIPSIEANMRPIHDKNTLVNLRLLSTDKSDGYRIYSSSWSEVWNSRYKINWIKRF